MTVGVGQILDKYELLEEVGRGGMAVVYRGLDTSLRREVAVKVLHRHLADNPESRARFEREAQAVAKLRHENILEIFDFSGLSSAESYIVTEFIDGQTLKEFTAHYHIRFPEVGAMIVTQVLQALRHAHGAGILHRDVKPENIMVRSDGVVKLTDFGIAQMVDLQRMTVTGQLLGSPAYMSPEHVSGGDLDFRTDIFSVGILLYQLIVGELPFEGKNPHEILKRIAECNYRAPQLVSPLVGDKLGRIVTTAMAQQKEDRYPDASHMLHDLEAFLEASGISNIKDELERFFKSPAPYEMALEGRLLSEWTKRGQALWRDDSNAALDYFNRVLTLAPEHDEVLALVDQASKRRRGLRLLALAGGVAAIVATAALARAHLGSSPSQGSELASLEHDAAATDLDAALADGPAPLATPDASPTAVVDSGPNKIVDAGRARPARDSRPIVVRRKRPDAAVANGPPRTFALTIFPPNSEVSVDGGPWQPIAGRSTSVSVRAGASKITVRNDACCQSKTINVAADEPGGARRLTLPYLPGSVIPTCAIRGVNVQVDKRAAHLGRANTILMSDSLSGSRKVTVEFIRGDGAGIDTQVVSVRYRETKRVQCAF